MDYVFNFILVALGVIFFLFIFGGAALSVLGAVYAYLRYHLFGISSPIIEDLFYRSAKGETTPPPSVIKGMAPILVTAGALYLLLN